MPSTITTYYTFAAATKARSSQVNTNFSNYRGDLLPINETTQTASDLTHNLGSTDHRWNKTFTSEVDLTTSTTTATLILKGDTAKTTGAFVFQIEGVTKAYVGASGLSNDSIEPTGRTVLGLTYTANGSFTVPAGLTVIEALVVGGGGGGGSAGGTDGAAGGCGAMLSRAYIAVTAGDVLSIVVGTGGTGAAASVSSDGVFGSDGVASAIYRNSSIVAYGPPGNGGVGAFNISGANVYDFYAAYNFNTTTTQPTSKVIYYGQQTGGIGGATGKETGTSGQPSPMAVGGVGGLAGAGDWAGGGGGGSYGIGGAGGAGTSGASALRDGSSAPGYGAGGGGGGASTGAGGTGGPGIVVIYYTKTT